MNLARSALARGSRRRRSLLRGLVSGDVERVPDLMRHHDRRDVFEIAQLHDLVVHRRRDHRIESRGRVVEQQEAGLGRPWRGRSRRAAAGRRTAPTACDRCTRRGRRIPAPPRRGCAPRRSGRSVSSYSRYPTFSATVSESNSAISWNDMPMSVRRRRRSRSGIVVDALAVHQDLARVGANQSENQLEQDRLSGAARAEQNRHAALRRR